ncbi:MAG TPA: hypothetical protein VFP54_01575 [Acidimicrobiales bacterium]|nr:hypothetical protein [Acidimicrobiales bacterium]
MAPGAETTASTVGNNGAYDPAYLQSAYGVYANGGGTGTTVAVVDAYDDPNAASDLSYYRSYFGLPGCLNLSCFKKVNETGGSTPPSANSSWAQEISLDVDMVSAICPNCNILLVEANSNSLADLGAAVNEAYSLGATAISNSYGGNEFSSETGYDSSYYDHAGTAVVASSGDNGYGVEYPAASQYVTAVGGTSLYQTNDTGTRSATETAWSGAGAGCSAYEAKPSWQHDTGCSRRTVADVSAVADPNTGVWVYDTYGTSGWAIFGGTSVASPIVASMFALGGGVTGGSVPQQWPYNSPASLNDITSGSDGSCGGSYLCTAVAGYDGPTGLGTPDGTTAFAGGPPPAPPGPPTNLQAVSGSGSVTLGWGTPSTGTATGYIVLRSTSSNTGYAQIATTSNLGYTDTAVTAGTTYYYEVEATNSGGTSSAAGPVSATPTAPTVGAPTLTAKTARPRGVNLSWTIPTGATGTYEIFRSTSSTGLSPYASVVCSSQCGYHDTGTTSGTLYYYQVAVGLSGGGYGPMSNVVSAKAR